MDKATVKATFASNSHKMPAAAAHKEGMDLAIESPFFITARVVEIELKMPSLAAGRRRRPYGAVLEKSLTFPQTRDKKVVFRNSSFVVATGKS